MAQRVAFSYEEDQLAVCDGTLIFSLMDRDVSGYLDCKELKRARTFMLNAFAGNMDSSVIDGLLNGSDDNNDGKVNSVEFHDFLRSIYEVLGKKRFADGVRSWKTSLYIEAEEERIAMEAAEKEKAEKEKAKGKEKSKGKSLAKAKTAPPGELKKEEVAATKIQARFRGAQAREKVKRAKTVDKKEVVPHDPRAVKDAIAAGRHLITVISSDGSKGNRADFYLDGKEITFTRGDGDYGRGIQVVAINPDVGKVMTRRCYDTVGASSTAENARLVADLNSLDTGIIILLAVKGDGLQDLDKASVAVLRRSFGAKFEGLGQQSTGYAFIGCKGYNLICERKGARAEAEAAVAFERQRRGERLEGFGA